MINFFPLAIVLITFIILMIASDSEEEEATGFYDKNRKPLYGGNKVKAPGNIFIEAAREEGSDFVTLIIEWDEERSLWILVSEKEFPSDIDGRMIHSINDLNQYWTQDIELIEQNNLENSKNSVV